MTAEQVRSLPIGLWANQAFLVAGIEWKKSFWSRRAIWLYLLALVPVGLTAIYLAMTLWKGRHMSLAAESLNFGGLFQFLILRFLIFFGAVGVFTNLIRGEVLNRTLHYYFLVPVRREVVLVGKYLAGVAASSLFFLISVVASYFLMMVHNGPAFWDFLLAGSGGANLLDYCFVTVLACAGYGAVFQLTSILVKNPLIPAAFVMLWELINIFLPAVLQKISIIYYLKSLCPVDLPVQGPLALIAVAPQPISPWISVLGVLVLSGGLVALGAVKFRQLQISYSD
jgi:ABC-type transport system involved in multi-copper enzyme maturation permease subunit